MKKEKIIEIAWFVAVLLLFLVSIKLLNSGELQEQVSSFGIWAPIVVVLLKIASLVIAPLGGSPLYLIAGALFGKLNGFILCFVADVVGSSICFAISRRYGGRAVKFFAGEKFFGQIQTFLNLLNNTKSFIKARLALFSLPEIFAYAAGLSRVSFWKFTIIHSIFILPMDIGGVFLGSQLATFASKYSLLAFFVVILVAATGFALLYKDFEKAEGM